MVDVGRVVGSHRYNWLELVPLPHVVRRERRSAGAYSGLALFSPGTVAINGIARQAARIPRASRRAARATRTSSRALRRNRKGLETQVLTTASVSSTPTTTSDAGRIHQRADRRLRRLVCFEPARERRLDAATTDMNSRSTRSSYDTRDFGWDVTLSGSHNTAMVLDLGIDASTGKPRVIGARTHREAGRRSDRRQWYKPVYVSRRQR